MSTTIAIPKICEFCGMEFTAQTTVTRFCVDLPVKLTSVRRSKLTTYFQY